MTPSALATALERLQLKPEGLARALDLHHTTIRRWLRGATPIPKVAELAIRWLLLK